MNKINTVDLIFVILCFAGLLAQYWTINNYPEKFGLAAVFSILCWYVALWSFGRKYIRHIKR